MKARFCLIPLLLATFAMGPGPVQAHVWELGLRVQNSGGQYVSVPVSIYRSECGSLAWSGYSLATPKDAYLVNLLLDLNGSEGNDLIHLTPDVRYTIRVNYGSLGVKSFYFTGHLGSGNNDDWYQLRPSGLTWIGGANIHELSGFPSATWTPLCLTLSITGETYVGSKTNYTLQGTAAGGGPYTITWTNVGTASPSNVNPSQATRTVVGTQSATVTCTVARSGVPSVTKSIVLTGGGALTPAEAVSWSWIKARYVD